MGDYAHRAIDGLLNSPLVPVGLRIRLMRALGYGVQADTAIWSGGCFMSKKITVGRQVFLNVGFFYDGNQPLTIGDNVRTGQFVRVITASHEIGPSHQRCPMEVAGGPVVIGDGCWIGACVTILPGVTIERGCVIAAGSLVTRSTEPDGLYAGTPARLIRRLPTEAARLAPARTDGPEPLRTAQFSK
jgi:maltose O-acetyltransferase